MTGVGRKAVIPAIPRPRAGVIDRGLEKTLVAIIESLETLGGSRGRGMDQAVRVRDLVSSGLMRVQGDSLVPADHVVPPDDRYEEPVVLVPPTDFAATGAFENIILRWSYPESLLPYVAYFEVYRAGADDIATASLAFRPGFLIQVDPVGEGQGFYYWVRAVGYDNVASGFNATGGTYAQTSLSVEFILSQIREQIDESILAEILRTKIDTAAAGVDANAIALGNLGNQVSEEITQRQDADSSLSQQINTVAAANSDNAAAIQQEQTARVSADDALAQSVTTLSAQVDDNVAALQTEQTARVDADTALGQRIDTVAVAVGENAASIQQEQTARADAVSSLASSVNTQFAQVGTDISAVQQTASAAANASGEMQARWDVKLQIGDFVYGVGFLADNSGASFGIAADRFFLYDPTAQNPEAEYPFIIDNGITYIDTGYIRDASIDVAKINNLAAEVLTATEAAIGDLLVDYLQVNNGVVGGDLKSSNYNGSNAGWQLTRAGDFRAFQGSFGGSLSAATGTFAGSLSAATGTFSGSLTAQAVNAVNTINLAGYAVRVAKSINLVKPVVGDYLTGNSSVIIEMNNARSGSRVMITLLADFKPAAPGVNRSISLYRNGSFIQSFAISNYNSAFDIVLDNPGAGTHSYEVRYENLGKGTIVFDGAKA